MPTPIHPTPAYTAAAADVLQAAILANPEARKAAVEAVLRAYFPNNPHKDIRSPFVGHHLLITGDSVEEWEGNTLRATYIDLHDACRAITNRK